MNRLVKEARAIFSLVSMSILSRTNIGHNIFDEDWDLLIVLDACRVDAIKEISNEYDFIDEESISSRWSVGSTSKEWINNTFTHKYEKELANTAYITANGFSYDIRADDRNNAYIEFENTVLENREGLLVPLLGGIVDESELGLLDGLWGDPDIAQDEENQRLPSSVTNHTIWVGRNTDFDRVIAHYMQPHAPFYSSSKNYQELKNYEQKPFSALRSGTPKDKVWDAYLDNLRFALDSVEILLNNFDAEKVIITADHGELFGELGLYSHQAGVPHPSLRRVPWVSTSASDSNTYTPDVSKEEVIEQKSGRISDESLKALGYL